MFNQNEQETILRLSDLLTCLKYLRYIFYSNKKIKRSLLNKVNTYVESTLKALMLYNLYKNESLSSSRARIIDDINDAISYKISLNDLLSNHNITDSDAKKLSLFKNYPYLKVIITIYIQTFICYNTKQLRGIYND